MTTNQKQSEEIYALLIELLSILEAQNDRNWSRGIKAAVQEFVDSNGSDTATGFENARSIYNTMTAGGRGFSEYFIWNDNEEERIQANKRLDDLRARIWKMFNP
jgi:type I site-specific restriction-modification system R (restriction) subunit